MAWDKLRVLVADSLYWFARSPESTLTWGKLIFTLLMIRAGELTEKDCQTIQNIIADP